MKTNNKMIKLFLFFLILICSACGNNIEKNYESEQMTLPRTENSYYVIDIFIKLFNSTSNKKIENLSEIDIHDKTYYKTEFRVNAFDNALAKNGEIEDANILLINYYIDNKMVKEPKNFRMYISSDNYENMKTIFTNALNIIDKSINDNEISEIFNKFSTYYSYSDYIGNKNINISLNYDLNKKSYSAMIDINAEDIDFIF